MRNWRTAKRDEPIKLGQGTPIAMSDGWHGKVTVIRNDIVVCQQDGVPEDDYLNGCRAIAQRCVTIVGAKATVTWNAARPMPGKRQTATTNRRQGSSGNVI